LFTVHQAFVAGFRRVRNRDGSEGERPRGAVWLNCSRCPGGPGALYQ
jgi:hypothetical protein